MIEKATMPVVFMWCGICVVALPACNSSQRSAAQPKPRDPEFRITPTDTRIPGRCELPFELFRDMPFVEASVDGHGPFRFLLDTGSTGLILSDNLANRLGIPCASGKTGYMETCGRRMDLGPLRPVASLQLGQVEFHNIDACTLDLTYASDVVAAMDGVLGLSLFKNCVLTINYPDRVILLEKADSAVYSGSGRLSVHWRDAGTADVELQVGEKRFWAMLDTGDGDGLTLTEGAALQLSVNKQAGKPFSLATFLGNVQAYRCPLRVPLRLGDYEIDTPYITVAPRMAIGGELLRDYVVTINQGQGTISLAKPKSREEGGTKREKSQAGDK